MEAGRLFYRFGIDAAPCVKSLSYNDLRWKVPIAFSKLNETIITSMLNLHCMQPQIFNLVSMTSYHTLVVIPRYGLASRSGSAAPHNSRPGGRVFGTAVLSPNIKVHIHITSPNYVEENSWPPKLIEHAPV